MSEVKIVVFKFMCGIPLWRACQSWAALLWVLPAGYESDFPTLWISLRSFFFSYSNLAVIKSINLVFRTQVHKHATGVACSEHKIVYS